MRLYLVCPLLLILGCAATNPEASIALKDHGKKFIILRQVDGMSLGGCAEVLLNSNVPGCQVDAKVVDRGILALKDSGQWKASLAPSGDEARHGSGRSRLTLAKAHPDGQEKPLRLCVEVTDVDLTSMPYSTILSPSSFADVYVTIYPPFKP